MGRGAAKYHNLYTFKLSMGSLVVLTLCRVELYINPATPSPLEQLLIKTILFIFLSLVSAIADDAIKPKIKTSDKG